MGKIIERYKGLILRQPTSGGKAGKGNNATSTIQVIEDNFHMWRIVKQIRFKVFTLHGRKEAIKKAKKWVDENLAI